ATGLAGSPVTFTATGMAGGASSMALNGGDRQTATVGTAVATAPAVILRSEERRVGEGGVVTLAVASGGGSVSPTTPVTTNASGIAAATPWTLGTTAEPNTLTATATGLAGSPVTFTASGTAGGASSMALNGGNHQTATVGTAVATAPSVIL